MRLTDVFGITAKKLETYVERGADDDFKRCLQDRQHIVLHGSSKQGKTSLRKRYLSPERSIAVSCQSDWNLPDLYISILKRAGIEPKLMEERVSPSVKTVRLDLGIPGLGLKLGRKPRQHETVEWRLDTIDPNDANDMIGGLKAINFRKWIVVEDFHYLPPKTQEKFAEHLKAFSDHSDIRFVLVAIWIGKNKITSRGDLAGRVVAVNADDWLDMDLREVIQRGESALHIEFPKMCKDEIIKVSGGSVFIVQDICRGLCHLQKIYETETGWRRTSVGQVQSVGPILEQAIEQLSPVYLTFLQAFAQGFQATRLEMHKWILYAILVADLDKLKKGLPYADIERCIKKKHPVKESVGGANLRNALSKVDELQWEKNIKPFVIDYDEVGKRLHIVDKSFFIWRKHQALKELFSYIDLPMPEGEEQAVV
jgi:hypothetical protein